MSEVADRYARAIFEVGEEASKLATVAEHVNELAQTYARSPELRATLNDPAHDDATRTRVLAAVASRVGACPEAVNALRVLMARGRLDELPAIAAKLMQLADEKVGVLRASVRSAQPLNDAHVGQLQSELEKVTGRRVVLERATDPSLISGLVLRIGSQVIDGSLRGRLEEFERKLSRAS